MEETQSRYLSLSSEVDERNFILTYLRDHTSCQRKGPGIVGEKTNFLAKGKSVCQKAWLIVHAGADLGFFVPQSKLFGRQGFIGSGRGLDWAWSTTGGEGGSGR